MAKIKSQRFVLEIPLKTNEKDQSILKKRFNVAHHIYNCFLGECEKRRKKWKSDPNYAAAVALLKNQGNKDTINQLFDAARNKAGYYMRNAAQYGKINGLEKFASDTISNTWLSKHIDSHTRNKLMERAFSSSLRKTRGKKVKFKRFGRDFIFSLEGKSIDSPLKWSMGDTWDQDKFVWSGLELQPIFETKNNKLSEKMSVIADRNLAVSFVRLIRKSINGKWRYAAQLICSGTPIQKTKHKLGQGVVGLDLGVITYAAVGDDFAELGLLGGDAPRKFIEVQRKKRIIARRIDRKRRKNNPLNFNPNGTVIKGKKTWIVSKSQKKDQDKLAELSRIESVMRKCAHGQLANKLRSKADIAKSEDIVYKAWQRNFGKSVGKGAPGMFFETLKRKFNSTGGRLVEINTRKAKLTSGGCPVCGKTNKKTLGQRIHSCDCGYEMQRDLTSALLAKVVDENTHTVDAESAKKLARESGSLLRTAIKQLLQSDDWKAAPSSFGSKSELSRIVRKR